MSKNVYITTVCGARRWAGSARPPHTDVSVITRGSKCLEGEGQTCKPRRSCLAVEVVPACKSARRVQEVRTWRTDRSKVCGAGQGLEAENALVNSSNGKRAGGWRERWAREGREAQTASSTSLRATRLKKPLPSPPKLTIHGWFWAGKRRHQILFEKSIECIEGEKVILTGGLSLRPREQHADGEA